METKNFEAVQQKILSLMETEGANWTRPWVEAKRPINCVSKKPYRGLNNFSLAVKGYEFHEWGTVKQWRRRGCSVKADQVKKSARIYVWIPLEKKENAQEEGRRPPREDGLNWFERGMFKGFPVYNAAQVDGYRAPPPSEHQIKTELTEGEVFAIDCWIANTGARITHKGDAAFYRPILDRITMPLKENFISDVAYYSTLLHELTHWTGHASRCKRHFSMEQEDYAKEELVAEIGSAMLCNELQIEKTVRPDHAHYLNHWIQAIRKNRQSMIKAFADAQKAIDFLEKLQEAGVGNLQQGFHARIEGDQFQRRIAL
ncbi:MAG: DUF1738 domain-containing protein [Gammaproteobacteria bacterium AqS3]|nr:DUF1738 domain-containing protein [Gammaproteobacteria bacterium AqS3]